ncbi:Dethiobiotin synthetase [hydrothermal vent metagenome]|uniref:Dethiobiotin synthetase n=1 Tax=hydrothermal vent metagenome TaxID=652676 RepID=A0A1W1D4B4_9ZZZZ
MAKKIFITATNTDIGKTYTTKKLLKHFASQGFRVGVIKPIETGVVDNHYLDGEQLLQLIQTLNPLFLEKTVQDIVPIAFTLPAAPYIASSGSFIDISLIEKKIQELEMICDILLIEGAGGLYVPINEDFMMIDLIKHLDVPALLVTHCSLGCINDTLLSSNALTQHHIKHLVAFNCKQKDEDFATLSLPYFQKTSYPIVKVDADIDKICNILKNF